MNEREEQSFFKEFGYVVLKNAVDTKTIDQIFALLSKQVIELKKEVASLTNAESLFLAGENVAPEMRRIQYALKGEFPLETRFDPLFLELLKSGDLARRIETLFSVPDIKMHYPPMVRYKDENNQMSFVPWHQDYSYFTHMQQFLVSWIPLQDLDESTKGLEILAGSHQQGHIQKSGNSVWNYAVAPEDISAAEDHYPLASPDMKKGDVLVLDSRVIHRSAMDSRLRISVDARWFKPQAEYEKRYYDVATDKIVDVF